MQASRVDAEEALRLGLIDEVVERPEARAHAVIQEVLTTGPVAIAEAKALTLTLDRWNSGDPELRGAMMELTSRMRESGRTGGAQRIPRGSATELAHGRGMRCPPSTRS